MRIQEKPSVMIPSAAHKNTIVEILALPREHVEYVLTYFEGDAVGDGWWKRADDSLPLASITEILCASPVVVVPVNAIRVDRKSGVGWQSINRARPLSETIRIILVALLTACVGFRLSGDHR